MAGMVKMAIKCTPKDNPMIKAIKTTHLLALGIPSDLVHLSPIQNNKADKKVAMAYTSASTAENQKVSVKANPKAPTNPLPKTAMASAPCGS